MFYCFDVVKNGYTVTDIRCSRNSIHGTNQSDPATRWIVKHSLRSLIKAGDPRALGLVGADINARVEVDEFRASPLALARFSQSALGIGA